MSQRALKDVNERTLISATAAVGALGPAFCFMRLVSTGIVQCRQEYVNPGVIRGEDSDVWSS